MHHYTYFQEIRNIGTINVCYPILKHRYKYESKGKWLTINICDSNFNFSLYHLWFHLILLDVQGDHWGIYLPTGLHIYIKIPLYGQEVFLYQCVKSICWYLNSSNIWGTLKYKISMYVWYVSNIFYRYSKYTALFFSKL